MRNVLISTPLLLEEGRFEMKRISLEEAKTWAIFNAPENFCGHETVRVLGVAPSTHRIQCDSYDVALALKPNGRLEFGKEYTVGEILEIGVTAFLITKLA